MELKFTFTQKSEGANTSFKGWCAMVEWTVVVLTRTCAEDKEFATVSLVSSGDRLTDVVTGVRCCNS